MSKYTICTTEPDRYKKPAKTLTPASVNVQVNPPPDKGDNKGEWLKSHQARNGK